MKNFYFGVIGQILFLIIAFVNISCANELSFNNQIAWVTSDSSMNDSRLVFGLKDSSERESLIGYEEFIKKCYFDWEDSGVRPNEDELNVMRKRFPRAIAPNVLLMELCKLSERKVMLSFYNWKARKIADEIIDSGKGSRENPFKVISFYDAYYFLVLEYGVGPYKADFVTFPNGRLLGECILYLEGSDEIIVLYFDLTHLKEYYQSEIDRINKHNEILFGL